MGSRRGAGLAVVVGICLLAGCGGEPDSDGAGRKAVAEAFNGFIGDARGGAGGSFSEPSDVAVWGGRDDGAGDDKIFVVEADRGRSARVQRLDQNGNFELAWGADVVRDGVAADTGTGPEICDRASWCKAAPPSSGAGGFRMPTAVAVNDSDGSVYVMDSGNRRVQQFTADGQFVRAWGWGVATGAARFERCEDGCRAGRIEGAEGDANPGQLADAESAGIAVRPDQGDVFVTDGGNRRVLQFARDGRFLREWRWPGDPRWTKAIGQPRHVAVDRDGIVYASDEDVAYRIVRFDATRTGREPALLQPLGMESHNSLGMELDAAGDLVTARDRSGPAVVDVITRPAERRVGSSQRRAPGLLFPGYVSSVNGVAVSPTTGVVYLAKSDRLYPKDPGTAFTACGARGAECHGLMVIAGRGAPRATLDPPRRRADGRADLAGTVTAPGAVSYRFQLSRDGGAWRDVAPARYLTAAEAEPVRAVAAGLDPSASYRARLLVLRTGMSTERFPSQVRNLR